jgi:hypothetical protein
MTLLEVLAHFLGLFLSSHSGPRKVSFGANWLLCCGCLQKR